MVNNNPLSKVNMASLNLDSSPAIPIICLGDVKINQTKIYNGVLK